MHQHTLFETTKFVRASINEVLKTLAEAIVLVTVIIYLFLGLSASALWSTAKLPKGLVPSEDKGVLMLLTYLMPGASLERTLEVQRGVTQSVLNHPDTKHFGTMSGIDLATFAFKTDAAIGFAHLKDWSARPAPSQSSMAIAGQLMGVFSQNKEAMVIAVNPPPIMGMSATGGFELYVQDRSGDDPIKLAGVVTKLIEQANTRPELRMVRTTYNANVPQMRLRIDRDKAKAYGVGIDQIYTTLGATFGTGYVNDFDQYGRVYHVNVQVDARFRDGVEDYRNIFVRADHGGMVPLSEFIHVERVVAPSVMQRFNMFNAAQVSGQNAPGYSSSDAMRAISEVAKEVLPEGYTIAWAGTSYQEQKVAEQGNYTFIYALLGASLGVMLRGLENDIYFQVGLVTLVGLAAKNAILIVEFAQQKLREGKDLYTATIEGARMRTKLILSLAAALWLGACSMAPKLETPQIALPQSESNTTLVDTQWWKGFGDARLDALIEEALRLSLIAGVAELYVKQTALSRKIALFQATREAYREGYEYRLREFRHGLIDEVVVAQAMPKALQIEQGIPSSLLERLPDIRAALERLHASNALIGVAKADYFPSLALTGSFGYQSLEFDKLMTKAAQTWSFGPSFSIPMLDFGRVSSNVDRAEAQQEMARIEYVKSVKGAFKEVYDALEGIKHVHTQIEAQSALIAALKHAEALTQKRYEHGYADYLSVLDTKCSLLGAEASAIDLDATRLTQQIALYKALGGGWGAKAD